MVIVKSELLNTLSIFSRILRIFGLFFLWLMKYFVFLNMDTLSFFLHNHCTYYVFFQERHKCLRFLSTKRVVYFSLEYFYLTLSINLSQVYKYMRNFSITHRKLISRLLNFTSTFFQMRLPAWDYQTYLCLLVIKLRLLFF